MWVQKYDLVKLKKDFFASEYTDVKSFLGSLGIAQKINTIKTKWWSKEKRELKEKAAVKALKKAETKLAQKLEPSSEFLLWNISKAIELSARKLEQMEENDKINVKDLSTIRWMNRIQNWQPTTYVKEDQDINQNVRIEWIHIIMWPNPNNNWDTNNTKEI